MVEYNIEVPEKLLSIITERCRYKVAWGGRGSAKSWTFARAIILRCAFSPTRVLCTREIQNSIRDSVYKLLCDQIEEMGMADLFEIYSDSIKSKCGSEIIFKGMHHHMKEIKSIEGIDIVWMEEASATSEESWKLLIPSIRKMGSEIWVTFNPESEDDPTFKRFLGKNPPKNAIIINVNWYDNPWFPEVLRLEMEHDKIADFETYEHVWLGKCKKYAEALIFKNVRVEAFDTPANVQRYYGMDFGFSADPSALEGMFIAGRAHDTLCPLGCRSQHLRLYIDQEAYGHNVELNDLHAFVETIPDIRMWRIRADSARPDTISFLSRPSMHTPPIMAFQIVGAEKGKNSVADGITFLKGFELIIIHPRCKGAIADFKNYKWKVDKITGEIMPIPLDAKNHAPDAVRYALEKYIKAKVTIYDVPNWGRMPVQ